MFNISYFNRSLGKLVTANYPSFEAANIAANEIFQNTGIIAGIEKV